MGTVVGRLGAPPTNGAQGLVGTSARGLSVDQLTIDFTDDTDNVTSAQPSPDGTVSVALPPGHYRVSIRQDPLAEVAYNTQTEIDVAPGETVGFFLPRISLFALHQQAKVDACGQKIAVDNGSGRFALGTNLGLAVGDVDDPSFAALIYDENAFANRPALVSLTHGGDKALVVAPEGLRIYDLSSLTAGTVVDCSAQDCFVSREFDTPPRFSAARDHCQEPKFDDGSGFAEVGEAGGFGEDYSVFHDVANGVFVIQVGTWAAFVDHDTGEVRRIIAEGGRFQGKHDRCNRYVFTYPHDNDTMVRIVDHELRIEREFDIKGDGIAATVEQIFNGVDDVTSGNFVLSTGLLDSNNDIVAALLSLDTCAPMPVVSMESAADAFGTGAQLQAGPIDMRPTRVVLADSLLGRSGPSTFTPIALNSRAGVDLSALQAHTNPRVAVDADATTYFVYGSSEQNAGMGFVNVSPSGALLSFAMRLGTEATHTIVPVVGKGAVVGATADGKVYWVLYDATVQPPDRIDHEALGAANYTAMHPTCSATEPCPDDGVCVPENDFVNSSGTCHPQPPEGRAFCGGVTDVACDQGYQCVGDDEQIGNCVPRRSCSQTERCAAGFICAEDLGDKAPGMNCFWDDSGREVCCHELEDGRWECCGEFGCEEVDEVPGQVDGPVCVPSDGMVCGGLHDEPCPTGRQCLMNLPEVPAGIGLCQRGEGEECYFAEQCVDPLGCNRNTNRCETGCTSSADCRQGGANGTCVVWEGSAGGFCDAYADQSCGDDEVFVASFGVCTTERPCDAWREDGNTGCDIGEVCVESHGDPTGTGQDVPPGAYCRPGCSTTGECTGDEVCAVSPWGGQAALHCTLAFGANGCPCADDEWCALDSQTCKTGTFCNDQVPCPSGSVCSMERFTCGTACSTSSDCGSGEICVSDWNGQRVCTTELPGHFPPEACQCGAGEYCHQQDGRCYPADMPPCSHDNQNCANGLTCDTNRMICMQPCSVGADCNPGQVCGVLDEWSGERSCRSKLDAEPSCTGDYFVFRDRCVRAPATGCFTGSGCAAGEVCDEWSFNNSSTCVCVDQSSCTTCAGDVDCMNGTSCVNGACAWETCPGGTCSANEVCADWLYRDEPPSNYEGAVYPDTAICLEPGTVALAGACQRHDDCASLLCANGQCVEGCSTSGDCTTGACVVGDSTMGGAASYCMANACNGCAADEVCFPWENRCSRYRPCGIDGACGPGLACANDFTCRPTCGTTSDCVAGENCTWRWIQTPNGMGQQAQICEAATTSNCAQCAAGESCLDNGQCSRYAPCGNNGACPNGTLCNTQMNLCQPDCASSADCASGEVCVIDWQNPGQSSPPMFCDDVNQAPCQTGCAANESCSRAMGQCTPFMPCANNQCPNAGEVCSPENLCIPTCQRNADCGAGDQCVYRDWRGFATCEPPSQKGSCACPSHLACLEPSSGHCGVLGSTCSGFADCNTNQGDGDDYLCQPIGSQQMCVCVDQTTPECIDCAGDHSQCDEDRLCGSTGVCEQVVCDPLAANCPTGTRCTRSNQNHMQFVCVAPLDARPDGIICNQSRECTNGICSWQEGACTSACSDSSSCAGNCVVDSNMPYGECRTLNHSHCATACAAGEVCTQYATCAESCAVNGDCTTGGCERRHDQFVGSCRTGLPCTGCTAGQYCDPWSGSCMNP